jgi:DNA (cytosine-5)-methyltransferase 1
MADGGDIRVRARRVADLFCGAGGFSTGAMRAARALGQPLQLIAVNHWPVAIATHQRNHPEHAERTHCADLESARPLQLVPEGSLDLLLASPSCVFHSRARGGKPVHDQQRMDPWHVVRWCTELRVKRIIVENVPEYVDWGPCSLVTGRPIASRRGEYFRAWCDALRSIGFRLDWRVLCSADYGDPTTRQRFYLIGRSDRGALRWPEPTHSRAGDVDLIGTRARWRAAAEIIDWTIPGRSIFGRKTPLKPNTIRRILAGALRYGWPQPYLDALQALLDGREPVLDVPAADAEPLLVRLRGTSPDALQRTATGLGVPLPALTAGGTHVGLVMATGAGGVARDLAQPIPTVTAGGDGGARPHLMVPLVLSPQSNGRARDALHEPMPTITTGGAGAPKRKGNARPAVVEALVGPYYGGGSGATSRPASHPLPAVTTKARFGLAEPLIVTTSNSSSPGVPRAASAPLRTITTAKGGDMAVASPFLVPNFGERDGQEPRTHSLEDPLPTVAASGHIQLAQPAADGYRIDILYRMLHWRELARAMSFDDQGEVYDFEGTATDITKQIGNAVSGRLAQALVRALLEDSP